MARNAKAIVEKHFKMIKEYDEQMCPSKVSNNKTEKVSDYHSFLRTEVEKINNELNLNKEVRSKLDIRKEAIERWKQHKIK